MVADAYEAEQLPVDGDRRLGVGGAPTWAAGGGSEAEQVVLERRRIL